MATDVDIRRGYIAIPTSFNEGPTPTEIMTNGQPLFYSPVYTRYVITPPIGVAFENGRYVNEYPLKLGYYDGGTSYFFVFCTRPNAERPDVENGIYYVDDNEPTKRNVFRGFGLDPGFEQDRTWVNEYEHLRWWIAAFGKNYELPYGATLYSSLPECIAAMDDGKWENFDDNDPFAPGGNAGTGGGTGSFDGTGDSISVPGLPTLSAVDTGFITLFNPTISQIRELCSYMWSDLFDLDTLKKLFADPMQAILGLSIVPVAVPNSGARAVKVGNISTGVSMNVATQQYVKVDCGTLNVNEYWGAYLDYDPYTKAEIYLPYIGTHAIAVDDIMNKPVHVVYNIDILSGACCAHIKCGESVLYTFVGQCSAQIPITGNDWGSVINGALSIAGAIGSMVATGGAAAPLAVSAIASTAVNSVKPNIEKSGAMSGAGGMLGVQTPYLILTRPRQALPVKQNEFMGYPACITSKLSDLAGYTEVDTVHLENIPATDAELSEIETLLKGGVIL